MLDRRQEMILEPYKSIPTKTNRKGMAFQHFLESRVIGPEYFAQPSHL